MKLNTVGYLTKTPNNRKVKCKDKLFRVVRRFSLRPLWSLMILLLDTWRLQLLITQYNWFCELSLNLRQPWWFWVNLAESGRSLALRIIRPLFWMTRGSIYRCRRLIFRLNWGETSSGTSGGPHARFLEIRAHFRIDSKLCSNRSRNCSIELKFGVNILQHVLKLLWKFHSIWTYRSQVMIDSRLHFWLTSLVRIDPFESIGSTRWLRAWHCWRGALSSYRSYFHSELTGSNPWF